MLKISKKTPKLLPAFQVFCYLLILGVCPQCNTKTEGCLDLNAKNFDFEAEKACGDCCVFPTMLLSLSQKWNEDNFSNGDTLYDIHGSPYKIQDLKYFMSNWAWRSTEGVIYTVDSVTGPCHSSMLTFTPDILTIDTRQFSYSLGTIRRAPFTDSVRFVVDLAEDYSCLDPEDPKTPSNVTDQSPMWNPAISELETGRMVLQRDLGSVTFDTVYFSTFLEFSLPYSLQMRNGFDEQFNLTVNYAEWFSDVDVNNLASFSTSVITHLPGSITPTE